MDTNGHTSCLDFISRFVIIPTFTMYGYGPYGVLQMMGEKASEVWCIDPDGLPVINRDSLPTLPFPRRVVIGERHIELDGWVFLYPRIHKGFLNWFRERIDLWVERDPSQREWCMEIIDTFALRLKGTF